MVLTNWHRRCPYAPYIRHCLGRGKRGGGRRRRRVLCSWKVWRGCLPPETLELLLFSKLWRNVLNDILSNYIAEMRGENYIRVGGFGPVAPPPPPPTLKSLWRSHWPLPSLFRTYLAVQNCVMEWCIAADYHFAALTISPTLRSRFLTAFGGRLLRFY